MAAIFVAGDQKYSFYLVQFRYDLFKKPIFLSISSNKWVNPLLINVKSRDTLPCISYNCISYENVVTMDRVIIPNIFMKQEETEQYSQIEAQNWWK